LKTTDEEFKQLLVLSLNTIRLTHSLTGDEQLDNIARLTGICKKA